MFELNAAFARRMACCVALLGVPHGASADGALAPGRGDDSNRAFAVEAFSATGMQIQYGSDPVVETFPLRRPRDPDYLPLMFRRPAGPSGALLTTPVARLVLGLRGILTVGSRADFVASLEAGPHVGRVHVETYESTPMLDGTSTASWSFGFGAALRMRPIGRRFHVDLGYHGDWMRRVYVVSDATTEQTARSRFIENTMSSEVAVHLGPRQRGAVGVRTRLSGRLFAAELTAALRLASNP